MDVEEEDDDDEGAELRSYIVCRRQELQIGDLPLMAPDKDSTGG